MYILLENSSSDGQDRDLCVLTFGFQTAALLFSAKLNKGEIEV